MTKKEIASTLRKHAGAEFVTISEISSYTGKSRDWVREQIVRDLDYLADKRAKRYFVSDVAESIMRARRGA